MLTAVRVRAVGDSGAYASVGMKVLERAAGHATGPYHVPAVDVEAIAARTNNLVCGAFRGFGANQAQFAMDGVLDRLAEVVGISGWEIRKRNVIRPGALWGPGQVMDDGAAGAEACLDAIKPAYDAAFAAGKAVGPRPRTEELGPRQRIPRGLRRGRAVPPRAGRGTTRRRGPPRLDGDGSGGPHRRPPGRRRGAEHRPAAHRGDRRHDAAARVRPDHRFARNADGSRSRAAGLRRGACRRLPDGGRLPRRARRRLDRQARGSRAPQPDDPRRLRLRRPARRDRPRERRRSSGSSPSTTSAGRSIRSCAPDRSRAACTWASAMP